MTYHPQNVAISTNHSPPNAREDDNSRHHLVTKTSQTKSFQGEREREGERGREGGGGSAGRRRKKSKK